MKTLILFSTLFAACAPVGLEPPDAPTTPGVTDVISSPDAGPVDAPDLSPRFGTIPTMFVGDDLTLGVSHDAEGHTDYEGGGFRTKFYTDLHATGLPLQLVGTLEDGPATIDRHHDGHNGFEIGDKTTSADSTMAPNIGLWVNKVSEAPRYVFLMAGTNDLQDEQDGPVKTPASPAVVAERLASLLDEIHYYAPNATVFVSTVPPLNVPGHPELADAVKAYNAAIPFVLAAATPTVRSAWTKLITVDVPDTMLEADGVHLTKAGDDKIADAYKDAFLHAIGIE